MGTLFYSLSPTNYELPLYLILIGQIAYYNNIQEIMEVEWNPSPYCENVFSYLYGKDTTYKNNQF